MILYEGPSLLDGTPIVVIATEDSNPKTGRMLFTWILRQDRPPEVAAYDGSDSAICGDCKFRAAEPYLFEGQLLIDHSSKKNRTCYVRLSPAEGADEETPPSDVWKKWKAGEIGTPYLRDGGRKAWSPDSQWSMDTRKGRLQYRGPLPVRIGSYGDPAAVPTRVWAELVRYAKNWTGYTHMWKTCDPTLKLYCMASVDTPEERAEAQALGWRTFMVTPEPNAMCDLGNPGIAYGDILCPATDPDPKRGKVCPTCKGRKKIRQGGPCDFVRCLTCRGTGRVSTTCAVCGLCKGTSVNAPSIWEVAHGKNKENHKW